MGMGLKTETWMATTSKVSRHGHRRRDGRLKSTAIGFAAGVGTHVLMEVQRRVEMGSSMT